MEDLLSMKLEDIGDPSSFKFVNKHKGNINPTDHYEVECSKTKTIFVGDIDDATAVFTECQSQAKALIRVLGGRRICCATNAPYMYLSGDLKHKKVERKANEVLAVTV